MWRTPSTTHANEICLWQPMYSSKANRSRRTRELDWKARFWLGVVLGRYGKQMGRHGVVNLVYRTDEHTSGGRWATLRGYNALSRMVLTVHAEHSQDFDTIWFYTCPSTKEVDIAALLHRHKRVHL
ncbi:hypothetical protein DXG01_010985 [Tephrocybe rancida]|nr:hypothetical protein DXG01_010985 [Tephrocybe rancida]